MASKDLNKKAALWQQVIYRMALWGYGLGLALAQPFHPKARLWVQGRKAWRRRLSEKLEQSPRQGPIIWLHAASLGEFEQGRPLIEALREQYPQHRILLTFFSPSGFEIRKDYQLADVVAYLPLDSPANARAWLDIVQPQAAFFIKYEFWYYYLTQLKATGVPTYLVAAIFRANQLFFNPKASLFQEMLHCYEAIFVQNEESMQLLKSISIKECYQSGDTRLDQVLSIKDKAERFPILDAFVGASDVLIVGSSWPADESLLLPFIQSELLPKGWKVIIAPHEIQEPKIKKLESLIQQYTIKATRYSAAKPEKLFEMDLLIIDNIGMLSSSYAYGKIAYVGGGFGKGIHNILEAAVFQIPVFFGPHHKKFAEAQELLNLELAFEVNDSQSLTEHFRNLQYSVIQKKMWDYFHHHKGATAKIIEKIKNLNVEA